MFKVKEYKEESDGGKKVIWTTEKVDQLIAAMEEGYQLKNNPFYDGDIAYKRGDITFQYTDWEYEEIKKCAKDIIYFANNYCTVMTDDGYMKITLREYQERVLKSYQENRWNIFLAARQIGKCHIYTTKIKVRNKETGVESEMCIGDLYYSKIKPSLLGRIKMILYKLIMKMENRPRKN